MTRVVAALAALFLLLLAGCEVPEEGGAKAKGAGNNAASVEDSSEEPTEEYEPEEPETYRPSKDDFQLMLKTTGKECFGSAGCNVEYKVGLKWVGPNPAPKLDKSYDIYFRVTGTDDGGYADTLTVTPNLRYSVIEGYSSTSSSSAVLKANLLRISNSNGF